MQQRNKRFSVRVNAHEYEQVVRLANTASMSVSNYSRKRVLAEPIITAPPINIETFRTLVNLKKELNAIGHNFNQVVKMMHINQSISPSLLTTATHTKDRIDQMTKILDEIQLSSIGADQ